MTRCRRRQILLIALLGGLIAGTGTARANDSPATVLDRHVVALHAAEDLQPILLLGAGRRAMLLGEASHGTQEYYTWRAEISKRLIVGYGFRFIAVEGDWGAAMEVNRYVKHLAGAPQSAAAALESFTRWPQWLWSNEAILELVTWLREHNAALPPDQRVGFYGIDVYGVEDSMAKAPRYLHALDPDLAAEAREAYACLERFAGDLQQYLESVTRGHSCAAGIGAIVTGLREHSEAWREADSEAYFHAKQNALVVKNAERHYRKMIARDHTSWNARARHFHHTLERLLVHYGEDARGIVWAHNTHIGDARATAMSGHGMVNIGQLARESLGREQVALVGFGTHRGEVVAGRRWEAPPQVMPVPPAMRGSVEDLLLQVSEEPFLFLSEHVRGLGPLDRVLGHRAIGVTYDPRQEHDNYVPTLLTERYDAFMFLPVTTALR
jgi:erythromycin esterase